MEVDVEQVLIEVEIDTLMEVFVTVFVTVDIDVLIDGTTVDTTSRVETTVVITVSVGQDSLVVVWKGKVVITWLDSKMEAVSSTNIVEILDGVKGEYKDVVDGCKQVVGGQEQSLIELVFSSIFVVSTSTNVLGVGSIDGEGQAAIRSIKVQNMNQLWIVVTTYN